MTTGRQLAKRPLTFPYQHIEFIRVIKSNEPQQSICLTSKTLCYALHNNHTCHIDDSFTKL